MKKLIKTVFFLCAGVSLAFANPSPQPKSFSVGMYNVSHTRTLKVFIEKSKGDELKITLKNEDGKEVSDNYVPKKSVKEGYAFDLSALEPGKYTLEITNSREKFTKEINVVQSVQIDDQIVL